jgi:hypothetical protein
MEQWRILLIRRRLRFYYQIARIIGKINMMIYIEPLQMVLFRTHGLQRVHEVLRACIHIPILRRRDQNESLLHLTLELSLRSIFFRNGPETI